MKSSTLLIVGAVGLAVLLFTRKASATPALVPSMYPGTGGSAGNNVGAIATGVGSLVAGFRGLFSGPTTAPLTSGASPSNPNDILALPTPPMPADQLQSLEVLDM